MRKLFGIVLAAACGVGALSAPGAAGPKLVLPKSRCFRMGFHPFPYAMTIEGIKETYEIVGRHSDLISHRLDDGVPWDQALAGTEYPKKVEEGLRVRAAFQPEDVAVFVSCSPLASSRDKLAKCWGAAGGEANARWRRKPLDHPDVIKAYLNYCRELIKRLKPDYFAYGINVNELAEKSPKALPAFGKFARTVYTALKWENPKLPVFLTFGLPNAKSKGRLKRLKTIRQMMTVSDVLAVSVFPYLHDPAFSDPRRLPADWLAHVAGVKGRKPFAVSQTGMLAEPLQLKTPKLRVLAKPSWQAAYVHRLCRDAQRMGALLVVWNVPIDYDELWQTLAKSGAPEVFKIWRDTGLYDGARRGRPGLKVWDGWRALPLKPRPGAVGKAR